MTKTGSSKGAWIKRRFLEMEGAKSEMFRFKPGINLGYERQGYIYFVSRKYKELEPGKRRAIDELCRRSGGEYWKALREFVTTDNTAATVCQRHYISKATLYRAVKRYYEGFPKEL